MTKQRVRRNRGRLDMALTDKDEQILAALEMRTGLRRASAVRLAVREAALKRDISLDPQKDQSTPTIVVKSMKAGTLKWAMRRRGMGIAEPWPICVIWETSTVYSGCYATPTTELGWSLPVQVRKEDFPLFDTEAEAEAYWRSLPGGDAFKHSVNWVMEKVDTRR
ncbi:MAG: hypothetical protein QM758_10950 [Armatimonas sp.]